MLKANIRYLGRFSLDISGSTFFSLGHRFKLELFIRGTEAAGKNSGFYRCCAAVRESQQRLG